MKQKKWLFVEEKKSTEEVGHVFKVTRERVRSIEAKALRKLEMQSDVKCLIEN